MKERQRLIWKEKYLSGYLLTSHLHLESTLVTPGELVRRLHSVELQHL